MLFVVWPHRGDLVLPAAAGRMRVRHRIEMWQQRLNPITLFVGYRWLAWFAAGIALTLPGRPTGSLPRDAGLLLIILLATLAVTGQAHGYLRLMQHRPTLLLLDGMLGWLMIALSGGAFWPFFPSALGSLIVPALLFGWMGALIGGVSFGLFYLISPLFLPDMQSVAHQAVAAPIFALAWAAFNAWHQQSANARQQPDCKEDGRVSPAQKADHAFLPGAESGNTPAPWYPSPIARISSRQATESAPAVSLRPDLRLAIMQLVESERQRGGLSVQCQIDGPVQRLPTAYQSVLLRTAQEALANVRRHAHASSCHVRLQIDERQVTLLVEDDGVGLLDGTYERPHLHALRALRYRIAEHDGQFSVIEGERGGLTVRVALPLER